jgi:hypothetical protein
MTAPRAPPASARYPSVAGMRYRVLGGEAYRVSYNGYKDAPESLVALAHDESGLLVDHLRRGGRVGRGARYFLAHCSRYSRPDGADRQPEKCGTPRTVLGRSGSVLVGDRHPRSHCRPSISDGLVPIEQSCHRPCLYEVPYEHQMTNLLGGEPLGFSTRRVRPKFVERLPEGQPAMVRLGQLTCWGRCATGKEAQRRPPIRHSTES